MYSIEYLIKIIVILIQLVIVYSFGDIIETNQTLFRARIVGIFVADSELPYTLELAKPSIEIAINKAKKLFPLISWDDPIFRNGSNRCTSNFAGVFAAEEFYLRRVTVFIGPSCGLALDPVARMASHWNIPVISSGGANSQFSNKQIFSTLTRLSFSLTNLGSFFVQIMQLFSWKHISIIVHETSASPLIPLIRRSIVDALDPILDVIAEVHEISRSSAKVNLKSLLIECSKEARIILILAFGETVRQILLTAMDLNMNNYVFLTVELFKHSNSFGNFDWFVQDDPRNQDAKMMYESLMVVTVHVPITDDYLNFAEEVIEKSRKEFNTSFERSEANVILAAFHDSVLLYGIALTETLIDKHNPLDGYRITRRLWNRSFPGFLSGDIFIDENGDQETDYTLNDFDIDSTQMKPVLYYSGLHDKIVLSNVSAIHWPNGYLPDSMAPPCLPESSCELTNKLIPYMETIVLLVAITTIFMVGLYLVYRKLQLESDLQSNWWRIRFNDLNLINASEKSLEASRQIKAINKTTERLTKSVLFRVESNDRIMSNECHIPRKAIYKGIKVSIKPLNTRHLNINRSLLLELKLMRELQHENIVRLIGLCPEEPFISILTEYCEKGNLRDLLDNDGIRIDWPFKYSLIGDIVEGMTYIHESSLNFHGNLKSSNCLIDSRLVVKLTDFGFRSLRNVLGLHNHLDFKSLLWTAPEHLRKKRWFEEGSQKGDVYSFSIILQEIITRSEPFGTVKISDIDGNTSVISLDPHLIIQQLKAGDVIPFRPHIDQNDMSSELYDLTIQCWDEIPSIRPSFPSIKQTMRKITKDIGSGNFLENLLSRMEQYANDLEILVEQKTSAFFEEKRKCEQLLYEVLPKTVADQLKSGEHVRPESFECVTIFFSDIVHFTQLSAESTPIEIVDFLNDLYTLFDSIINDYSVYKVETVGDAYMVVSGLPVRNGNEHSRQIARMSLDLLEGVKKFQIKHLTQRKLEIRIGIHSGPCAAGVIGLKMPRYCLFGDTVNTASRMESTGMPNKIHISSQTKTILDKFGTFLLILRGDIEIKGKGCVRTYFLEKEIKNSMEEFDNHLNEQ